jgi:hypothetical protein
LDRLKIVKGISLFVWMCPSSIRTPFLQLATESAV